MHARMRLSLMGPIVGAVLLTLALVALWAAMPEAVLVPILLAGIAVEVMLYGVLYAIERRRHW